jgi:hypothetical protein
MIERDKNARSFDRKNIVKTVQKDSLIIFKIKITILFSDY